MLRRIALVMTLALTAFTLVVIGAVAGRAWTAPQSPAPALAPAPSDGAQLPAALDQAAIAQREAAYAASIQQANEQLQQAYQRQQELANQLETAYQQQRQLAGKAAPSIASQVGQGSASLLAYHADDDDHDENDHDDHHDDDHEHEDRKAERKH